MQGAEEDLAFAREAARERLPKFVELLKFKNLSVGAKVWGCIASVSTKELVVSLPDGLRGIVPLAEVTPTPRQTTDQLFHFAMLRTDA